MNRKLSLQELNRLSPEAFKKEDKHPICVILDNIRSMHNVGSVFRTADAFKLGSIVLTGITPKPPHRDIRKTAIGATETVNWSYAEQVIEAVQQKKSEGYTIVSVEQTENSIELQDYKIGPSAKICLVLGNEVGGVDQTVIDMSDICLEIPQFGTKHSLNVSVCGGIVIWEVVKQII